MVHSPQDGVHPVYLAHSRLRRRRFDDTVDLCSDLLSENALDQQVWYLKVRALTMRTWFDDTELEGGAISI
jgi:tetratricopeptide repeat protein 8